ncbi:hypothetical protein A3C57_03080 [Candidatus Nomurabacteria bacterium RIFCSPHIGHO2_02_FULL_33_12]|nr:MAG: hypothetical protein A3C57_03080 [Candidatus Nomurabacteria bacterium RIFCSPHIGHO2_02_FULL_33_12]
MKNIIDTDEKIQKPKNLLKIEGEIGFYTNFVLEKFLEKLKAREKYQIKLETPGGNTYYALKMLSIMSNSKFERCEIVFAGKYVYSAGIYVYVIGEERVSGAKTQFHIHRNIHTKTKKVFEGDPSEDELNLWSIMAELSHIPRERIKELAMANNGHGTSLGAFEAKDLGLVNEIWDKDSKKIYLLKSD